jgi:hypothetical protein
MGGATTGRATRAKRTTAKSDGLEAVDVVAELPRSTLIPRLVPRDVDLTGCVLAESGDALVSKAIRLKQIDGLNHNAVVIGPGGEPNTWRIAEAIAAGCIQRDRPLSTGYIIRFDDDAVRAAIADAADDQSQRGWKYDYWTIGWHACDALLWLGPLVAFVVAALWLPFSSRAYLWAFLVGLALHPIFRAGRWLCKQQDRDDRKICSELTIGILRQAGVQPPERLFPNSRYRPTPIDVTRWLMGRADWRSTLTPDPDTGPSALWAAAKEAAGVHYSIKTPGETTPPDD